MPRIEVLANAQTTSAPGWAYVAVPQDGYLDPSKAPIIPTGARARNKTNATASDAAAATTSRQQAAVTKRLAELDRDASGKEIPVPDIKALMPGVSSQGKNKGGTPSAGQARVLGRTQSVRRILTSQKTFANYLADEEAARVLASGSGSGVGASSRLPMTITAQRSEGDGGNNLRRKSRNSVVDPTSTGQTTWRDGTEDVDMVDAQANDPVHAISISDDDDEDEDIKMLLRPQTHHTMPSTAEIELLLSAPPLTYNAAKAGPPSSQTAPPPRVFCEICGYWGRVRCVKCGSRVCGLDCKEQHMLECSRRYA